MMTHKFEIRLKNGFVATIEQIENGMHLVEIRDKDNNFDSSCTCNTTFAGHKFIDDFESRLQLFISKSYHTYYYNSNLLKGGEDDKYISRF